MAVAEVEEVTIVTLTLFVEEAEALELALTQVDDRGFTEETKTNLSALHDVLSEVLGTG